MSNVNICVTDIIPTYDSLIELFEPLVGFDIEWPSQLTLPTPMWPDITSTASSLQATVTEMLNSQLAGMISALIDPLIDYLGLTLEDILPDIPGFLGITLIQILDGTALNAMIELIKLPDFDFSFIALLPLPIYLDIVTPVREALTAAQTAIAGYYQMLMTVISDLIAIITDDLELPSLPTLPTMPTLDDILALLPDFPTFSDLINLELPVFGQLMALIPDPLIPSLSSPSYDFNQGLKLLYNAITNYIIKLITDFVESLPLSFNFPLFCLSFNVPDIL